LGWKHREDAFLNGTLATAFIKGMLIKPDEGISRGSITRLALRMANWVALARPAPPMSAM
jgi:hypothetical protein